FSSAALRRPIADLNTDQPLSSFVNFLKPFSASSKFIVLDEFYPHSTMPAGIAVSLQKRLMRQQKLDDLRSRYQDFISDYESYFRRIDQLPARFPNLVRHNTSGPLCSEEPGSCWWYNRSNFHAYFTDNAHLSADGLELERASYKRILDDLIMRVKTIKN
ncbi:hypothetical protein PMAYCL1PPCAC_32983, partial [Pristionchus mayeri]